MSFFVKLLRGAASAVGGGGGGGGSTRDAFELELRAAADKLRVQEAALAKERRRVAAIPAARATEVANTRDEARRKLLLLYAWGLSHLVETYYAQAVLQMKRVWLKTVLDAAVIAALDEALATAAAWR